MDTKKSSAPYAHPSTEERECFVCYRGLVYIGRLDVDPETGDEVEVVEAVPCRRCNA